MIKNTNTKVIAIAGSYGKTTVKNYIFELTKYNYKTQVIPGNINTPTGISQWLLKHFNSSTEILIAEVDTYYTGEIKKSLKIIPPDIAILTNVGDQHLERFRSRKHLRQALLEIFKYAKAGAIKIKNKKSNLDYALEVAKILKIPKDIADDTLKNLKVPQRRGNLDLIHGFETIDNSYNINTDIAKTVVFDAKKFTQNRKKKLIVITAGIPELGKENKDGNKNLGKILSFYSHKIILLQSILYADVLAGIKNKDKVVLSKSLDEAFEKLEEINPKDYLLLLLPELNDLYYN